MRQQYSADEVDRLIRTLAEQIASSFGNGPLNIVGIRTRGETLAERITEILHRRGIADIGRGSLDITLYRDDLSEIGPRPIVYPTQLKIPIDGVAMVLVDDVIFTGRTVRAALNELADFGRPSVVRLATLVDRGGRELPIRPDSCPLVLDELDANFRVQVKLTETDGVDEITIGPRTPHNRQ